MTGDEESAFRRPAKFSRDRLLYGRRHRRTDAPPSWRWELYIFTAALCLILSLPRLQAQKIVVSSAFNPPVVTEGRRVSYEVVVEGAQDPISGQMPAVRGLSISTPPSVSKGIQIINRKQTVSITYSFPVQVTRQGTYTAPQWEVTVKRQKFKVPAATLKVVPSGDELKNAVLIRLERPKESFFVGEAVPCKLKIYQRQDIHSRLRRLPEKSGDAFTQSEIGETVQTFTERLDNMVYSVTAWSILLTPLKAGNETISYTVEVLVEVPAQSRGRTSESIFERMFGDPFDPFFQRSQEAFTISSGDVEIPALELPLEDRPSSFSGAIGAFTMQPALTKTLSEAGEPITLTLTLTGSGNFERVAPPDLAGSTHLKVYPPKSTFEPSDRIGWRGTKTFEYILIPESEAVTEVPSVPFSFFDPEQGAYIDASSEPLPVTITPAPPDRLPRVAAAPIENTDRETNRPRAPALLGIKVLPGTWVRGIHQPFTSQNFLLIQLVPLAILCGLYLARKHHLRLHGDAYYARQIQASRSMRKWLQEAKGSAAGGDSDAFFAAAQRAIQESLAKHFDHRAETLVISEVEEFLSRKQADQDTLDRVRRFFEVADAIRFAGAGTAEQSLNEWNRSLVDLVNRLSTFR